MPGKHDRSIGQVYGIQEPHGELQAATKLSDDAFCIEVDDDRVCQFSQKLNKSM
jgi:hypothetical protein